MKTYAVRLRRGSDLLEFIKEFCIQNNIKAGVVLSGVGCVTKGRVRDRRSFGSRLHHQYYL